MTWQFNPYAIPLFLSAIPLVIIIYAAWQRRSSLAARLFIYLVGGALGVVLAYSMELLQADLQGMMFWLRFEYLFHSAMVFYPLFALAYSGYEASITPRRVLPLFILPAIIFVLISTNEWHGLIYAYTGARRVGSVVLFERTYGAAFWVWLAYLSANFIAGYVILIRKAMRSPGYFRGQIGWLALAVLLPAVGIALTQAKLTPIPLLDLTPYAIALACIPLAISLFRFNLFDIVPAAYEQVIESMDDAVIVCDDQHRIVQSNRAAARLTGRTVSQNLGCRIEQVLFESADIRLEARVFSAGGAHEVVTSQADATERYFDVRVSPLRDRRGLVTGQVFVLRDITDRKRVEHQSLDLAIERERVRLLQSFIRDVSHDFRTPISVILTSVYLLNKFGTNASRCVASLSACASAPNPEQLETGLLEIADTLTKMRDKSEGIHSSALRLERLIESMLEATQLDGAFNFEFGAHDLNVLVADCVQAHCADADQKQLRLGFEPGCDLPQIRADGVKLSRAIAHLLENALQYTLPNGTVCIRTCLAAGEAIVQVSDTGIGIGDDDLPHIFEQFYRADKARSISGGGAGLGLFIARRIVEAHDGRIEVESAVGQGSVFRICLPLSRETGTAIPASEINPNRSVVHAKPAGLLP